MARGGHPRVDRSLRTGWQAVKDRKPSNVLSIQPKQRGRRARRDKLQVASLRDVGLNRNQASTLIDMGRHHHLFHDEGGDAYAEITGIKGKRVLAVSASEYRDLLGHEYFRTTGKAASRGALAEAVNTLAAIAKYDGSPEPVFLRVAATQDSIVIDLGDETYCAIEVTRQGWRVVNASPVHFRRSGKPLSLPFPRDPGISPLWQLLNIVEQDRPLVLAWLLSALRPQGPHPVLLLVGEQGCAKSTAARILKLLTDPSAALLRAPPKDERDLLVAARSSWVVALDNLSGIGAPLSDALCRVVTGGALSSRKLYSDFDEVLVELRRPIILNGIDELASRPDLAQRCIQIELPVIPENARRTEAAVMADFNKYAGAIFAALLDALVVALRNVDVIELDRLPRMADFAKWSAAGLPALGVSVETFLTAYAGKQAQAVEDGLDTSVLARTVRFFMEDKPQWEGAKAELLKALGDQLDEPGRQSVDWPKSTKALTSALRRLAPSLRHVGILCDENRTRASRTIRLRKVGNDASQVSRVTADAVTE